MINNLNIIGTVSSEGGPLIVGDSRVVESWRGFSGEAGDDYTRACALFDSDPLLQGGPIEVGDRSAILWEMQGGGIAHVCDTGGGEILIVRSWLAIPDSAATLTQIVRALATTTLELGTFQVQSSSIAMMWAAESGDCITDQDLTRTGEPSGDLSVPGSAFLTTTLHTNFLVTHDFVEGTWGQARRCHLIGY